MNDNISHIAVEAFGAADLGWFGQIGFDIALAVVITTLFLEIREK